jgi:hypothetical protein
MAKPKSEKKTVDVERTADDIYLYLCGRAGQVLPANIKEHIKFIIKDQP